MRTKIIAALLGAVVANSAQASSVHEMNQRLAMYVHPTHKCGPHHEALVTHYGNGDGNVGKPVFCGGVLDRKRPTAAQKHPRCGSKVKILDPRNGRAVTVTITDKGPFTNAEFDLGPAATKALGTDDSRYLCIIKE